MFYFLRIHVRFCDGLYSKDDVAKGKLYELRDSLVKAGGATQMEAEGDEDSSCNAKKDGAQESATADAQGSTAEGTDAQGSARDETNAKGSSTTQFRKAAAPQTEPMRKAAPPTTPMRKAAPETPMHKAAPPKAPMRKAAPPMTPMRKVVKTGDSISESSTPQNTTAPMSYPQPKAKTSTTT